MTMVNKMEHILTSKSPTLDLHGEISSMVEVLVNTFILENYKKGESTVRIIHGKSTNILTKETHLVLKKNPYVEKYFLNNWNIGETVVYIKTV